jgi:lauroyl/myristoyl acyltransferase
MKTYYLLVIASWLARWIPPRTGYWLCSSVGGIIFYVKPSIRQAIMDNMRHVLPRSSERQRRTIARRVIRNNFKNYYDLIRIPHLTKDDVERMVADVHGTEYLDEAFARGKGVIIISGHIGNFNIVPQIAIIRGYPVVAIAEDIKPQKLYDFLNNLRMRFGLKFINANSSQVRTIYKLLRDNGGLILAADKDVTEAKEPVLFFDAVADLPPGPVALALRLDSTIIPAHSVRLRDNTSVLHIYPPMELERTGDKELDKQVNLRKVAIVLEEMIRKAPDQWAALQRVWDRPPDAASASTNTEREPKEPQAILLPLEPAPTEERSPSSVSR